MEQFSTPQKMPIRAVLKEINSNEFTTVSICFVVVPHFFLARPFLLCMTIVL